MEIMLPLGRCKEGLLSRALWCYFQVQFPIVVEETETPIRP